MTYLSDARVDGCSFGQIIKSIDVYINLFLENGLVGFKQIHLTTDEQKVVTELFGSYLDWKYIPDIDYENHLYSITARGKKIPKDELIIRWHLEHVERVHSQIAASWNMLNFTCPPGCGSTGFISSTHIYNLMPDVWKTFLASCIISHFSGKYPLRKAVDLHRNSHKKILKLSSFANEDKLISINNKNPTDNDLFVFEQIKKWYCNQIFENKNLAWWWNWDEGDFIIIDLTYIIHAVKGGFTHEERIFSRLWAYSEKKHEQMYAIK